MLKALPLSQEQIVEGLPVLIQQGVVLLHERQLPQEGAQISGEFGHGFTGDQDLIGSCIPSRHGFPQRGAFGHAAIALFDDLIIQNHIRDLFVRRLAVPQPVGVAGAETLPDLVQVGTAIPNLSGQLHQLAILITLQVCQHSLATMI